MLRTFNSGIGMCLVVDAREAEALTAILTEEGETVHRIGTVGAGQGVSYTGSLR